MPRSSPRPPGPPTPRWTLAQLREHALALGLELTGAERKADVLAALTEVPEDDERTRGQRLRAALVDGRDLDAVQVLADEAGRIADRLDELDRIIAGKGVLRLMQFRLPHVDWDDDNLTVTVKFDNVLGEARQQASTLRQILQTLGIEKDAKPEQSEEASPLAVVLALARGTHAPGGAKARR